MPPCEEHSKIVDVLHMLDSGLPLLQKDIEYLRRDQEVILARFGNHVADAERAGGRHERLRDVEEAVKLLKEQRSADMFVQRWFMIGSGVIGGLIGSGAPGAVTALVHILIK